MRRKKRAIGTPGWRGAIAVAALSACGGAPQATAPSDAPSASQADAAACITTPLPAPTSAQVFDSLAATIVDPTGVPRADAPLTVCSFNLCMSGQIDASGAVTVKNAASSPLLQEPALKIGDGLAFAELAYLLPDRPAIDVGTTVAIPLPAFDGAPAIVAGGAATSSGVTISVAAGTAIGFDEIAYLESQRGLRVAPIGLTNPPLAVDPGLGIGVAYAVAPQGTTFCPPASLDAPNTSGWPAGTAVEVLVHGVDLAQTWAPYGGWGVVAAATVSADGSRIRTDPGSGLPVLSAIGLRRK